MTDRIARLERAELALSCAMLTASLVGESFFIAIHSPWACHLLGGSLVALSAGFLGWDVRDRRLSREDR